MGQIRITGGTHRSRKITVTDLPGLRPTTDRVRETLFNWLGQNLWGQSILDLYAGSGILAFESASRGANLVCCVDNSRQAVKQLKANVDKLDLSQIKVTQQAADQFVANCFDTFDLVFLDPPFEGDELNTISGIIGRLIKPEGLLYREYSSTQNIAPLDLNLWTRIKHKQAGQVHFELWQKQ